MSADAHGRHTYYTHPRERLADNQLRIKRLYMVEAAGVEPASENVDSKEPTYLVTFICRC